MKIRFYPYRHDWSTGDYLACFLPLALPASVYQIARYPDIWPAYITVTLFILSLGAAGFGLHKIHQVLLLSRIPVIYDNSYIRYFSRLDWSNCGGALIENTIHVNGVSEIAEGFDRYLVLYRKMKAMVFIPLYKKNNVWGQSISPTNRQNFRNLLSFVEQKTGMPSGALVDEYDASVQLEKDAVEQLTAPAWYPWLIFIGMAIVTAVGSIAIILSGLTWDWLFNFLMLYVIAITVVTWRLSKGGWKQLDFIEPYLPKRFKK